MINEYEKLLNKLLKKPLIKWTVLFVVVLTSFLLLINSFFDFYSKIKTMGDDDKKINPVAKDSTFQKPTINREQDSINSIKRNKQQNIYGYSIQDSNIILKKEFKYNNLENIVKNIKPYIHYYADISKGSRKKSENIIIDGEPRDSINIKGWGYDSTYIWRIQINKGMHFKWNCDENIVPDKVILVVKHMTLINDLGRSFLNISINGSISLSYLDKDGIGTSYFDISDYIKKRDNDIHLSSAKANNLLHGLQSINIYYYKYK